MDAAWALDGFQQSARNIRTRRAIQSHQAGEATRAADYPRQFRGGVDAGARLAGRRDPAQADAHVARPGHARRSEEHTSELQSLMRISYAVFCLKKKKTLQKNHTPIVEHKSTDNN